MIWCYSCQKQTTLSQYSNICSQCSSAAVEISNGQSIAPNIFKPYVIGSANQQPQNVSSGGDQIDGRQDDYQQIDIPITFNVRTMVLQSLQRPGQFTVIRVVSTGINPSDTKTPVPNQVFEKLQRVNDIKQCTICQDEGGHGLKLKCEHCFHDNCLKPWIEQTNTCPTCRTQIKL